MTEAPSLPGLVFEPVTEEHLDQAETRAGVFSGQRLRVSNPRIYEAVVRLTARGMGLREVAEVLQVSTNTAAAVIRAEWPRIETAKQQLGRTCMEAATYAAQTVRDLLIEQGTAAGTLQQLAIVAGIMTDKALLASGEATARVEVVQVVPEGDELDRILSTRRPAIDVEAVEIGLTAGAEAQKDGAAGPAAGAAGVDAGGSVGADAGEREGQEEAHDAPR